ncbi:MAG: CvpA family protein [Planctomycetaceae bacterium]|nr:CvpA family protein [Planctomycetaceae bacterium]
MILDAILVGIVAVVTWCVASEGAWGAALTFISVLISALLATGFFEMAANFLEQNVSSSYDWQHRWDVIAMVGLFAVFVFALRTAAERIMPVHIELHGMVYDVARWGCSFLAGCVTMAFLLTALHTAPLPPGTLGFRAEPQLREGPLGQAAPDYKWLGFVHVMTEKAFRGSASSPIFDGPIFVLYSGGPPHVLPSFPIRYASRRDRLYGAAPAPSASGGTSSPASRSGRSSGPAF